MAVEQLLEQIAAINKRYEEIAKVSGENFNIFNILDLTSKELIHSKIIAMLLDPEGEHGMGDLFFKLLIKTIAIEKCSGIDYSGLKLKIEKSFEDGRIDILITTRNKKVIIENKIYAGDQDEQILRYHNKYPDAVLLYLTLDGHSPEKKSSKDLEEDQHYFCISYKDHILRWLELCRKETVNSPFLRETMNQYILLVKQLTGQARSKQMNNEIVNVITKSEENFKAYWDIIGINRQEIITHVFEDKVLPSVKKVAKEHGLEFLDCSDINILEEQYGYNLKKPEWKEIEIDFYFSKNLTNLVYYIHDMEKEFNEKWEIERWGFANLGKDIVKILVIV
jgi:hypothetical protein